MIWKLYAEYLWNYQPNSWVARIASACRVLAILIGLPIVVLALLDISSYGIARTLGVIDDVKASTSDAAPDAKERVPPVLVETAASPERTGPSIGAAEPRAEESLHMLGVSQPQSFYASEENNLKLSGVDVFSPATSRPPSPSIRKNGTIADHGQESANLRQRVARASASDTHRDES